MVDEGLEAVVCHIGGRLLGVGSQKGTLSLLHLPPRLIHPSDRHEKSAFTAVSIWMKYVDEMWMKCGEVVDEM